jgi:hypothetical protein
LSGAHNAVEALESTCIGCGLPGTTASAAGTWDPSLQAVITLRHACWHQATGATVAAAGMWEPSLWAAGVLEPGCWSRFQGAQYSGIAGSSREPSLKTVGLLANAQYQSQGSCCRDKKTKSADNRDSGVRLPAQDSGSIVQCLCCQLRRTKSVGSKNSGA